MYVEADGLSNERVFVVAENEPTIDNCFFYFFDQNLNLEKRMERRKAAPLRTPSLLKKNWLGCNSGLPSRRRDL
jgi:hypothetical protein